MAVVLVQNGAHLSPTSHLMHDEAGNDVSSSPSFGNADPVFAKEIQLGDEAKAEKGNIMSGKPNSTIMTIVLVHGGFADGSGWEGVYKILKKDGYTVSVVQNPTISLADDVAVTKRVLATHSGPVILVGHSYGGAVITEAGNDPKVAGLVYITAFALDNGESVSALIKDPPPGAPVPPILPPQDGFLFLDNAKFPASFPADVDAEKAAFMADAVASLAL